MVSVLLRVRKDTAQMLNDRIIEYVENGCKLKPMYEERINSFFEFHDKNNCERVYKAIIGQ